MGNVIIRDAELQRKLEGVGSVQEAAAANGVPRTPQQVEEYVRSRTGVPVVARVQENGDVAVKRLLVD